MRTVIVTAFAAIILLSACVVGEEDVLDPEGDVDEPAGDDTDPGTSGGDGKAPFASVAPGCSANVTCSGTKTCGAWTAYSACGAPFQTCREGCGFITRWGCTAQATVQGQNRSRTCVMRATGATCVEVDYREVMISCPV